MATPTYRVVVCDEDGVPSAELHRAVVGKVVDELNGWGSATFTIPTLDPKATKLHILVREPTFWSEVQIWRNGTLIFWGPPVRASGGPKVTTIQCFGLLWYFTGRFIGPNSPQFLLNPDFESGLTSWSATVTTASSFLFNSLRGTKSALLTTASPGLDAYLSQSYTFVHGGSPGGAVGFDVAAWFYIDVGGFTGPAFEERGLYVRCHQGATTLNEHFEPINNSSPHGQWVKLVAPVYGPTGATSTIEVRLYGPGGTIEWDSTAMRVSSFVGASPAADLGTTVLANVVNWALATDPVSIATSFAAVLVYEDRKWLTEDHANIWQIMQEWPARNLSDFAIVWNATGTTRTFTNYVPRRGTIKLNRAVLVDAQAGNRVREWGIEVDLTQSASQVRCVGSGSGVTREFGLAEDATALGGRVIQASVAAPPEATPGVLDNVAGSELARRRRPVRIPSVTVPADPYLAEVAVGDTIPVAANYGWWQDPAGTLYRVVARELTPRAESLKLVLNQA